MVKKILLWARSTEIWIVMAQIYTVLLCLFMVKCHLYGAHRVDKYIGALAFALILALSFRYSLYKLNAWWIYFVFFIVAYAGGISEKLSVTKVFGTPAMRNWYFYLLSMIVAYVLTGSKRDRWFIAMAATMTTALTGIFIVSIIGATKKLLNPEYKTLKGFGYFISGRLSTFTSANTAGPAAAVLILLSILLIIKTSHFKLKVITNILFGIYALVGWTALGLSRSRGAIIAAAAGIGVIFFVAVYDRIQTGKVKAFFVGAGVCLCASAACVGLFLIPKPVFDRCITEYVNSYSQAEGTEVKEKLEVYGITYAIDNLTDRTDIWSATVNMLDERPRRWIFGVTAQRVNDVPILDIYADRPEISMLSAHSGYLEQLYMYGIPGAALMAILLVMWIICAMRAAFSKTVPTADKSMLALMAAAMVNAFVEAFLYPFYVIYPISFYFFVGEGWLEGSMEKKEKSIKSRIIALVLALVGITAVGFLTYAVYSKSKEKYDYVEQREVIAQDGNDYVRLNNNIEPEMMSPEYWTELRIEQGADPCKQRLSSAEIDRFNNINRRMIVTGNTAFSLYEIGDEFYVKVAKGLVKDTMVKVSNPEKYLLNGEPTDSAYWEGIEKNANYDALETRISVKYGISVSNKVLKRFPTDDDIYAVDSNMYYDELAQSDLLPFMPVAILHESLDSEWYYVITYGYGGWARKEDIALCESKEDWLSFANPSDFIIVTGKELRISTDPYNESMSGTLIPMGTKLPIVSIKDAPEDIHNRIGFGNYVAKLPVRNEEGMAEDVYVLIPASEDVNPGYLPYTEENVAKLAFKHLGAVYGWAGDNNGQDCSGYVHEIFACFGYTFPRATKPQAEMESTASYDVSEESPERIKEILKDAPIGTLMYFPGHIMIYLGTKDGVPYCISSVGNFATKEAGKTTVREVNTVILTDMIDTVRADGTPWVYALKKIVVP